MTYLKFSLYAIFMLLFSGFAQASDGLVRISSTFFDEGRLANIEVTGTGFVVSSGSRCFVLTAAHLSDGRTLKMDGTAVAPIGYAASAVNDLGLIEIRCGNQKPIFYFNGLGPRTIGTPVFYISSDNLNALRGNHRFTEVADDVVMPDLEVAQASPASYKDPNELLLPHAGFPWLIEDKISGRLQSSARIAPGNSGSPIIKVDDLHGRNELIGIALAYERRFPTSYFIGRERIESLVFDYLLGTFKGGKEKIRYWNGIGYIEFSDGTRELNPDVPNAGNGETTNGGNGETTNGGNGETVNGGDSAPFGQVNDLYKTLRIRPGILWKGKQNAIAVQYPLRFQTPMYANLDAILVSQTGDPQSDKQIQVITLSDNLTQILLRRYERSKPGQRVTQATAIGQTNHAGQSIGVFDDLRFEIVADDAIRFTIPIRMSQAEVLSFVLNKNGMLIEENGKAIMPPMPFEPILQIKGPKTRMVHWIDLRAFYFLDLSRFTLYHRYGQTDDSDPQLYIRRGDQWETWDPAFFPQ